MYIIIYIYSMTQNVSTQGNTQDEAIEFMEIITKAKNYDENKESYHYLIQCLMKKPLVTVSFN